MNDRFDIELSDPFRWMETDSTRVESWLVEQHARGHDARDPKVRAELLERLTALTSSALGELQRVFDEVFYTRVETGRRTVWTRRDGRDTLALDPATVAPDTTLLSWSVSAGKRYIAANLAPAGDEIGVVYIYDLAAQRPLPDRVAGVHKDFSVEWIDDRAFLYSAIDRSSPATTLAMRLCLHELGETTDRPLLDEIPITSGEFPFAQTTSPESPWLIACISSARSAMRVYATRLADSTWLELATYADDIEDVRLVGDQLYMLSSAGAPYRRVERHDLTTGARTTVVAPSSLLIQGFAIAEDGVYVRGTVDGVAQLRRIARDGQVSEVALPRTEEITRLTADPRTPGVAIAIDSWVRSTRIVEVRDGVMRELCASDVPAVAVVADFIEVRSHDGELVPLTILRAPTCELDGSHPTILEAYGGYGLSLMPSCERFAWIGRGGVYAIAHVRGGGEKGRAWYLAGKGANKINGVRDFIACAQALCDRNYTRPERLAATAVSMGALVVGGAMLHAPTQFAAIAIHGGMLNPMRYHHSINGEAQAEELGSVEHEADIVLAMDVYLGLSDATRYPPVMLSVGINDERVSPWMTSKFAARLLASHNPVVVRVDRDGHGMTASPAQIANRLADIWSFFALQLER